MPDITMCQTKKECPQKELCYRYIAKPDSQQWYFTPDPDPDGGSCEYFMPVPDKILSSKEEIIAIAEWFHKEHGNANSKKT
jgi:hypothetical protein